MSSLFGSNSKYEKEKNQRGKDLSKGLLANIEETSSRVASFGDKLGVGGNGKKNNMEM